MCRAIFIALLLLCGANLNAQYRCIPSIQIPGNPGYVEGDDDPSSSYAIGYIPSSTPTWSQIYALPIPFYFNGVLATHFKISNTGVITFDTAASVAPPFMHGVLPNPQIPNKSICICGLRTSQFITHSEVNYSLPQPARQWWITFKDARDSSSTGKAYWSIVLEENTNNIYFVDQYNYSGFSAPLSIGIQINDTAALMAPGSPSVILNKSTMSYYSGDNYYYAFLPGNSLVSDGGVTASANQKYTTLSHAPFTIKAAFKNLGADTVHSLQLHYSINSGNVVSQTFSGLNIPQGYLQWLTFNTLFIPATSGVYTVDIFADALNTGSDQDTTNDHFIQTLYVEDTLPKRRILFEECKSIFCASSGIWTRKYDTLLNANAGKVSSIKYEMFDVEDDNSLSEPDCNLRLALYNSDIIPTSYCNGSIAKYPDDGSDLGNFLGCPWNVTQRSIDSLSTLSGLFYVEPELYRNNWIVQGNVKITSAMNIPTDIHCRMYAALIEDSIFSQVGLEPLFVNTSHKSLPTSNGISIGHPSAGHIDSISFAYQITDHKWDTSRLHLVVFVQDTVTKEIFQCAESPIVPYLKTAPLIPFITGVPFYCPGYNTTLHIINGCSSCIYNWSNGETGDSISVDSAGFYFVTAVNASGSATSQAFYVRENFIPAKPQLSGNPAFCVGNSTELYIDNYSDLCNYIWSAGIIADPFGSPRIITASTGGNYMVTVSTACGTDSASILVIEKPKPLHPTITGPALVCPGAPITLAFNNACSECSYLWSNGDTTQTTVINTPGIYRLRAINTCGVDSSSSLTVSGVPLQPVIGGDTAVCVDRPNAALYVANPNPNVTYLWNTGSTSTTTSANTPGYYFVTGTSACGLLVSDSVFVAANHNFANPVITGNDFVCTNIPSADTITVNNVCSECTYEWSNNVSGLVNVVHGSTGHTFDDYWVTVTNVCATRYTMFSVLELGLPEIEIRGNGVAGNAFVVCPGVPVTLSLSPYWYFLPSISWWDGYTTYQSDNLTAYTTGYYVATLQNQCGTNSGSVALIGPDNPAWATISGVAPLCPGQQANLYINNAYLDLSYVWSTHSTDNYITINQPGTYTVTATNYCGATAQNTYTVQPVPLDIPIISGPNVFCTGDSINLTVSNPCTGCHYSWSTGATSNSIRVNSIGNYVVSATNACNSIVQNVYNVHQTPPDTPAIAGQNFICAGANINLTVNNPCPSCIYSWNTGEVNDTITINSAGNYIVTVTNRCNLTAQNQLTVQQATEPDTPVIAGRNIFCTGDSISLSINNPCVGCNYSWSNGGVNDAITINSGGRYVVTVTNSCNLTVQNEFAVQQILAPDTPVIAGRNVFCAGDSINLSVSNPCVGCVYSWSNGAVNDSININSAGNYVVTATNTCNAIAWNTFAVQQIPAPDTPVITGQNIFCAGDTVELNVSNPCIGCVYTWSTGATGNLIVVSTAGQYGVAVANACNDIAAGLYTLSEDNLPQPQIVLTGGLISFNGTGNFAYQWYLSDTILLTGANSNTLVPALSGNYSLVVTNSRGCSYTSNALSYQVTDIALLSFNQIKVYPSITTGKVIVDLGTGLPNVQYVLLDMDGKLVMDGAIPVAAGAYTLSLNNIASGVYLIRLNSDTQSASFKIVKINQ